MGSRLMTSPFPWKNEPDPVAPIKRGYRRIYDTNATSVARVYNEEDAKLIVFAPQLRALAYSLACGETISPSTAAQLYLAAGGVRPLPVRKGEDASVG